MSLYARFKTDQNREITGVVHEVDDGVTVTLARWGNPKHIEAENKARAPFKSIFASGREISPEVAKKIQIQAMVGTVVVDWNGVTTDAGEALPFTRENCIKVLTDLPDFRSMCIGLAQDVDHYRAQQVEADIKN